MSKRWNIYSKNTPVSGTPKYVAEKVEYHDNWMGEEYVLVTIVSSTPLSLEIGDYLVYRGRTYSIYNVPSALKQARAGSYGEAFKYENVKLSALSMELSEIRFLDIVLGDNQLHYTSLPTFSVYCETVEDLVDRLQANTDRAKTGSDYWFFITPSLSRTKQRIIKWDETQQEWVADEARQAQAEAIWHSVFPQGYSPTYERKNVNVSVDKVSVWDGLALVKQHFGVNFIVDGRTAVIGAASTNTGKIFSYGKGNGLYQIEKMADSDQAVVTKMFAYGSEKNLPSRYYSALSQRYFVWLWGTNSPSFDESGDHQAWYANRSGGVTTVFIKTSIPTTTTPFTTFYRETGVYGKEYFATLEYPLFSSAGVRTGELARITVIAYIFKRYDDTKWYWYFQADDSYGRSTEQQRSDLWRSLIYCTVNSSHPEYLDNKISVVDGINLRLWPESLKVTLQDGLPDNMAVNVLMLPGFPLYPLGHYPSQNVQGLCDCKFVDNENGGETNFYLRKTTRDNFPDTPFLTVQGNHVLEFSTDKLRPWIKSPNATEIGVKEGDVHFDEETDDNGLKEITPSIEGMTRDDVFGDGSNVRLDEIVAVDTITDNGVYVGEDAPDFTITIRDLGFDLLQAFNDAGHSMVVSMKDGHCGGRDFTVVSVSSITDDNTGELFWVITLNREYDEGLELYFPYSDAASHGQTPSANEAYQIQAGDHFVLTGIYIEDTNYVWAASVELLRKSIVWLTQNDYTRFTYLPKIDEIFMARDRDNAMANNTTSQHDALKAGKLMSFADTDFEIDGNIYIDSLTIKEGGNQDIPTYDVVLREEKQVGQIQRIQNQINSIISGNGVDFGGAALKYIKQFWKLDENNKLYTDYDLFTKKTFLASGSITGLSFIKYGGTPSQFLKADGSIDETQYATAAALNGYLPLIGGVLCNNTESPNDTPLTIKNGIAAGVSAYINFAGNNGNGIGKIGVDNGVPKFIASNLEYILIHSGNWNQYIGTAANPVQYASNVAWSGVTGKPTTIAGYGITDLYFGTAGADYIPIKIGSGNAVNVLTHHQSLANYYTKNEADAKFLTIAAFETLFNAMASDGTTKIAHPYTGAVASIKAMFGLWTNQYLSALGLNSSQGGGGATTLDDLTDVEISSPQNGQVLKYDATTRHWVNANDAGITSVTWANILNKPTTISGYGITDAYISNGTIYLGSNSITPLTSFTELDPTVPAWAKQPNKPSYSFSEITGTAAVSQIPSLDASKITSGTFDVNRIPNITVSKITDLGTTLAGYLPLSGGVGNTMTGDLYVGANNVRLTDYADSNNCSYSVLSPSSLTVGRDIFYDSLSVVVGYNSIVFHSRFEDPFTHDITETTPISISSSGIIATGDITANAFKKSGGTSSQFLKADGSIDSNAYWYSGNHPTTIVGYGISDAYISNGVITLGTNTIKPLTSVALSMPTGFSVSGSPINDKTGTFTVTYTSGYEAFTTALKNKIELLYSLFTREGSGTAADPYIIKANYGLYTNQFLSALGLNTGGSGGGVSALSDLTDVQLSGLASGNLLKYNGTHWVNIVDNYATQTWVGQNYVNLNSENGLTGTLEWSWGSGRTVAGAKIGLHNYVGDDMYVFSVSRGGAIGPHTYIMTDGSAGFTDLSVNGNTVWHSGNHPTTLGNYGITDAYISNGTIYLGANSITPLTSGSFMTTNTRQANINGAKVWTGNDEGAIPADGNVSTQIDVFGLLFTNVTASGSSAVGVTTTYRLQAGSNGLYIGNEKILTSSALNGYATEAWVNNKGYITASALNGYATETWVGQQGYITSAALSGYATQSWVQNQGYLTSSAISDMATQTWVGQQGYLTSASLNGYATQTWVSQQGYITSSALNGYATQTWVGQQGYITSAALSNYMTTDTDQTDLQGVKQWTITSGGLIPINGNVSTQIDLYGLLFTNISPSGQSAVGVTTTYRLQAGGDGLYINNNKIITSANIGSQSVAYALSAGSATDSTKLPLVGGDMTGQITRNSGGSWIFGRDYAIIRTTRTSSAGSDWHPAVAVKTSDGCWTFGSVGGETLMLSYDTDANYNQGNNDSAVINFPAAGSSGTLALTSQIPTNNNQLTNGAGYITSAALNGYATQTWVGQQGYIGIGSVKGNLSSWDNAAMGWGTLTAGNGYTIGVHASSSDGGDWGMAYKSGQISMQLDGYFYQNEGAYRVLDTSDAANLSVNYANSAGYATSAGSATDSTKLPLAGGTMSGDIIFPYGKGIFLGTDSLIVADNTDDKLYIGDDDAIVFSINGDDCAEIDDTALSVYGNLSATGTITQNGYTVIHAGNIGTQSVNYAVNATRLYASDSPYRYGDSAPYYAYITYNTNSDNRWYLRMTPATPATIAVDYAYSAGSATDSTKLPLAGGTMTGAIKWRNERTGVYNLGTNNTPSGYVVDTGGGNQNIGIISWDGASDEGGALVGSDCFIIYNSSDSGAILKVMDKDVSNDLTGTYTASNCYLWVGSDGTTRAKAFYEGDSHVITAATIGSQSVSYATSAGSAGSVAWSNVTGKPSVMTTDTDQIDLQGVKQWTITSGGLIPINGNVSTQIDLYGLLFTNISPSGQSAVGVTTTYRLQAGGDGLYINNNKIITSANIGSQSVAYALSAGSATDRTKLPLSGGTMVGTIDGGVDSYSGGGFHSSYANIILRGNETTGSSAIVFSSSRGNTDINRPSDCGFIQFHPYGISALASIGSNPTIGTSGESNKLVIGVNNDSDDEVWLQTPAHTGLKHIVGGTSSYNIIDSGNWSSYIGTSSAYVGYASYATSAGSAGSATNALNLMPENTPHYFRDSTNSSWRGGMFWGSAGSEAMSFVAVNGGTRFQFVGGSDIASWASDTWSTVNPYLEILSTGTVLNTNNSWLTPSRLQLMRYDTTAYTDRACIGVTNGNLHIDSYPSHEIYLNYYSGNTTVYIGSNTVIHSGNIGSQSVSYAQSAGSADTFGGYYASSYMLKKNNAYFYNYVGQSQYSSTGWYKVTFPHHATTSENNRWFMLSFDVIIGGSYNNGPSADVRMNYYFYSSAGSYFSPDTVYGIAKGVNIENLAFAYDNNDGGIMYIYTGQYYSTVAIKNFTAQDSAPAYDYTQTVVEPCDTPSSITYINIQKINSKSGNQTIIGNAQPCDGYNQIPFAVSYTQSVANNHSGWVASFGTPNGGVLVGYDGSTPIIGTSGTTNLNIMPHGGNLGIYTNSPSTKFDVNGISTFYQRGLDNTAFKNVILLKAQNNTETWADNYDATYPSHGIGFVRYWSSGTDPYGETLCAGIYTYVTGSWRGGLIFRTKQNQTQGGTPDTDALRLAPSGDVYLRGNLRICNPNDGQILARFLNYDNAPYGLMFKSYSNGKAHIQSQREANDSEVFELALNPYGGTVTANGYAIIHAGNIGSQSVSYATSAGSAGSVAWSNVTGKPSVMTTDTDQTDLQGVKQWTITSGGLIPADGNVSTQIDLYGLLFTNISPSGQSAVGVTTTYRLAGGSDGMYINNDRIVTAAGDNIAGSLNIATMIGTKVGIGTIRPSYKLDVNGAIRCTELNVNGAIRCIGDYYCGGHIHLDNENNVEWSRGSCVYEDAYDCFNIESASTDIYCNEAVHAPSFVNDSDARLKNITAYDIYPRMEAVANAPTIRFRWNDKASRKDKLSENVGSIAQYWKGLLPEAVSEGKDGYLSMQYDIIALLATISVAKRVVDHERRIEQLERENAMLRMEINDLKDAA